MSSDALSDGDIRAAVVDDEHETSTSEAGLGRVPLERAALGPAALDAAAVDQLALRRSGLLAGLRGAPAALRPLAVIAVFAAGLVGGIVAYGALNPPAAPLPWPAMPAQSEPAAAHQVAAAIASNDPTALADAVDFNALSALGDALQPIIDVTDVRFTGAVNSNGDEFAGYLVYGRDDQGADTIVGFVVHVRDGVVVGVNT